MSPNFLLEILSFCFTINSFLIEKGIVKQEEIESRKLTISDLLVNFNVLVNELVTNKDKLTEDQRKEKINKLNELNNSFEKICHFSKFSDINEFVKNVTKDENIKLNNS